MPGYSHKGDRATSGKSAGQIDRGAVPKPCEHDHPEDNTRPGTPRPMDKPADKYTANESHPSMDRFTPGAPSQENPGDYSKKFA